MSGQVTPATGMVCNLVDLDQVVRREVLERFDHQNLNQLPEFAIVVPTTENLCESGSMTFCSSGFGRPI